MSISRLIGPSEACQRARPAWRPPEPVKCLVARIGPARPAILRHGHARGQVWCLCEEFEVHRGAHAHHRCLRCDYPPPNYQCRPILRLAPDICFGVSLAARARWLLSIVLKLGHNKKNCRSPSPPPHPATVLTSPALWGWAPGTRRSGWCGSGGQRPHTLRPFFPRPHPFAILKLPTTVGARGGSSSLPPQFDAALLAALAASLGSPREVQHRCRSGSTLTWSRIAKGGIARYVRSLLSA